MIDFQNDVPYQYDGYIRKKQRIPPLLFVALERLELSQTEPESGVLPLHHKAIFNLSFLLVNLCSLFDDAKLVIIFEPTKFFRQKISKNFKKFQEKSVGYATSR